MSIIERQTELGKSLYEINNSTVSEITELSRKNVEQYFEVNRSFGERLPEANEISSFLSLQREYGETLWANAREAMESQNAIIQNAFSDTREAFKSAFTQEADEVVEVVEAKPKTKKAKTSEV